MKLASGVITIAIGIALAVWSAVAQPFGDSNTIAIIIAALIVAGGVARVIEAVTGRRLPISFGAGSDSQGPTGNPYDLNAGDFRGSSDGGGGGGDVGGGA